MSHDQHQDRDLTGWEIAEQAVLGRAIESTASAAEALAVLSPHQFGRGAHRAVFEAVSTLSDAGTEITPVAVLSELARVGLLAKVTGPGMGTGGVFLHSLLERRGDIGWHAPQVIAAWQQRNIRTVLDSCAHLAASDGFDPDIHLDKIRQMVDDATAYSGPSVLRPNSETVTEVLDALQTQAATGLPTGYADLDAVTGGMRPGELIIVGARPSTGKTLLGLCIADHVGTSLGLPVLFASLEMTEEELTLRRIAATAKVPLHYLIRRQAGERDWEQIRHSSSRLLETALHIDDTPGASLAHIRGRLRSMARTGNPARLLVIDYLGFLAAPKAESRQQAVAALARGVKSVAREFTIPVLLLAQLNRGPESRSDKRPSVADLRESGEVEQTADIVLLLHREDVNEPESPRSGEIDVIVGKNRQGPLCTVTLHFQGHYARIKDMAPADWSPSVLADPDAA